MGSGSGNMAMTRLARTADLTWSSSFTYQRMTMVKVKMIIITNMMMNPNVIWNSDLTWSPSFTYQRMVMKIMKGVYHHYSTQRESRQMKTSLRPIAECNF